MSDAAKVREKPADTPSDEEIAAAIAYLKTFSERELRQLLDHIRARLNQLN